MSIRPLTTLDDLEAAFSESAAQTVVIFKHSGRCGTSALAYEEIEAAIAGGLDVPIYLVDVLSHRAISQAIAARAKVRHESPQVLLIRGGAVVWTASHFHVTAEAVAGAVSALV